MRLLFTFALVAVTAAAQSAAQRTLRVPLSFPFESDPPVLKTSDVKAAIDGGANARVLRVRSPQEDLLLLVVLDLVGDLALVDPARTALAEQIQLLPKNTWTGFFRAQDGLQVLLDPGPDREKVSQVLGALSITGSAGLLNTVQTAAEIADAVAAKSGIRVAVLYLTDSDVRNYREDFTNPVINSSDSRDLSRRFPEGLIREKISTVTEGLAASQTPVFILHLAYSREQLNEAYQSGLMQLASATGGSAVFCRSQAEIPGAVAGMIGAIQSHYSVFVQLPPKHPRTVNLTLKSEGRNLSHRSRFVLR
jgi:hypothetical protein